MAKIGNLEIDTGKIANGAVTTVVEGTESITVANPSGYPVQISAFAKVTFPGGAGVSGTTATANLVLKRTSDNKVFFTWTKTLDGRTTTQYTETADILDMSAPVGAGWSWTFTTSKTGNGGIYPGDPAVSLKSIVGIYVVK